MATNVERLTYDDMFGSTAEIARIAGIDKAAVVRWRQKRHPVQPKYQERLMREAKARNLNTDKVARALGLAKCPACGTYHIHHID